MAFWFYSILHCQTLSRCFCMEILKKMNSTFEMRKWHRLAKTFETLVWTFIVWLLLSLYRLYHMTRINLCQTMNEIVNLFMKSAVVHLPSLAAELITWFIHWVLISNYCANSWIKNRTGRKLYLFSNNTFTLSLSWKQIILKHGDPYNFCTEFGPVDTSRVKKTMLSTIYLSPRGLCPIKLRTLVYSFDKTVCC